MPRRPESAELSSAREQLRVRYETQQAAAAAFFDAAAGLAKLRREVDVVEGELRRHAATLADALGADTAAQVTGWTRGRLVEAQRAQRSRRAGRVAEGVGDEDRSQVGAASPAAREAS